ncbi:unnamed protein product [Moneuplotes crassus]|uniref:Uncharacterized protein n=1 Tax=Euplotes crassus TaxID=5936 RepID=A0AAD1X6V7_EUPCR|nr:unnamed protein product [Moneuplotes crassus]
MKKVKKLELSVLQQEIDTHNLRESQLGGWGYSMEERVNQRPGGTGLIASMHFGYQLSLSREYRKILKRQQMMEFAFSSKMNELYNISSAQINWEYPKDVKTILRTCKPRIVHNSLVITGSLYDEGKQNRRIKAQLTNLLGFAPYTLRQCVISGLVIDKIQMKKIFQYCSQTRMLEFHKCMVRCEGLVLNKKINYKTTFIMFKDLKEENSDYYTNKSLSTAQTIDSIEDIIKSISTCSLQTSLQRLSLGRCTIEKARVDHWLVKFSLVDLPISFYNTSESTVYHCCIESGKSDEKVANNKKCIIQ